MRTSQHRYRVAIGMAVLLALGACDGSGKGGNAVTMAGAADSAQAKLNAYVTGYNKLIGTFGLPETAEKYEAAKIPSQSATDSIIVSDGWIEQATTELKQARALPGGPADLDQAGDALIASLDKLLARLQPLNVYYDSKAYKDDKLARGKAEDGPLLAEFRAALASSEAFNAVLKRERKARTDAELAEMKNKGDTLAYSTKLALQKSEALVDLFHGSADLRNPALIAKGDALVAEIEKALDEQRAAYAKAKAAAKTPAEAPAVTYWTTESSLTTMLGYYRDLKQNPEPRAAESMIKAYNQAIESANMIR